MLTRFATLSLFLFISTTLIGQVIISDFAVNTPASNVSGVGKTAIAAHTNGNFAVSWQDFNEYNIPVAEIPRVAVQLVSPTATAIGPLNVFRGESRNLSIWTSDYLSPDLNIDFLPDGSVLVVVEHVGDFSIGPSSFFGSETGIGQVSASGEIIDVSNSNGVILWLIPTDLDSEENPRIAIAPDGSFFVILQGDSFASNFNKVMIQQFATDGSFVGDFFTPHSGDPNPSANHTFPDVATNGSFHAVVWQNGLTDNAWDISAQFYNNVGTVGANITVNSGDVTGNANLVPTVAMNSAGTSVIVWADFRDNVQGEIYGQRFDNAGQRIGNNFRVSNSEGTIWDRPEVAIRDDGSFMVVWTDSMANAIDVAALRARGRQYDSNGNPTGEPFIVPNQDLGSGLISIDTDGSSYYSAWLDVRADNVTPNVYASVFGDIVSSVEPMPNAGLPTEHSLAQNYPNPFNPETRIEFDINRTAHTKLTVFDQLGRVVSVLVNETLAPGGYAASWDATNAAGEPVAGGIYYYQLQAGSFSQVKKMLLVR